MVSTCYFTYGLNEKQCLMLCFITPHNVYSANWAMSSTWWDAQYTEGISKVWWRDIISTSEGVEYTKRMP